MRNILINYVFIQTLQPNLEVKDTTKSEQNLSLHPMRHGIEPNQSNQTIISPPSNNKLSDNPTSTSPQPSTH